MRDLLTFLVASLCLYSGQSAAIELLRERTILEQTRELVFHNPVGNNLNVRRPFCDGHEGIEGKVCCELYARGWGTLRIPTGRRTIRFVMSQPDYTFLDIGETGQEITGPSDDFGRHIQVRCRKDPATMETLQLAFGDLFDFKGYAPKGVDTSPYPNTNPPYQFNFRENEEVTFSGETFVFLSHATTFYAQGNYSEAGIQNLADFAKANRIPSFGIISADSAKNSQFYRPDQATYLVPSRGGQIAFKFPEARNFLIGGGNLHICLCELMRDLIKGSLNSERPINLFIITDATYDDSIFVPRISDPTTGLMIRYKAPITVYKNGEFLTAELVRNSAQDPEVVNEYISQIFGATALTVLAPMPFCPQQNAMKSANLDHELMSYSIYLGPKYLKTFVMGSHPSYRVRFILTESKDLKETLAYWKNQPGTR